MALLKKWRDMAYSETADKGSLQKLWTEYFQKERRITECKIHDLRYAGYARNGEDGPGCELRQRTLRPVLERAPRKTATRSAADGGIRHRVHVERAYDIRGEKVLRLRGQIHKRDITKGPRHVMPGSFRYVIIS